MNTEFYEFHKSYGTNGSKIMNIESVIGPLARSAKDIEKLCI